MLNSEMKPQEMRSASGEAELRDRIRGCLTGGAAGDALGFPIEFMEEGQIFREFGPSGIRQYRLNHGKALISDDTQMTMFTANTVLLARTGEALRGMDSLPHQYMENCYGEWYMTQISSFESCQAARLEKQERYVTWLMDVP